MPLHGDSSATQTAAPTPAVNGECPERKHAPVDVFVRLTRTNCYGECSNYTVVVHHDGSVDYHGAKFVKFCEAGGHVSAQQLAELDAMFRRIHFVALPDYREPPDASDASIAVTSYAAKTLTHYIADENAPKELYDLEKGIERIVGIEQWTGTPDEVHDMYGKWLIRTSVTVPLP